MTGPEHYREAERLTNLALHQWEGGQCNLATDVTFPQAQVHATLALAAATAEPWLYETSDRTGNYVNTAWLEAIQ